MRDRSNVADIDLHIQAWKTAAQEHRAEGDEARAENADAKSRLLQAVRDRDALWRTF